MGKFFTFVMGCLVGGAVVFTGLKYHVVRANDGVHLIPKVTSDLHDIFVDIRGFTLTDWDQHRTLAIAIVRDEKGHLLEESAHAELRGRVDSVLDALGTPQPQSQSPSPQNGSWGQVGGQVGSQFGGQGGGQFGGQ